MRRQKKNENPLNPIAIKIIWDKYGTQRIKF